MAEIEIPDNLVVKVRADTTDVKADLVDGLHKASKGLEKAVDPLAETAAFYERSAVRIADAMQRNVALFKASQAETKKARTNVNQWAQASASVVEQAKKSQKSWSDAAKAVELVNEQTKFLAKDVKETSKVSEQASQATAGAVAKVGEAYEEAERKQTRFVRTGFSSIRRLRDRINLAQFAVAGLVGTLGGAVIALDKLGQAANTREGLVNLGIGDKELKRINASLGGTVDKLTVARQLLDARNEGASVEQFQSIAKSAAVVAKELGIAKQEALALVAQGNLTDGQLMRIGTSAIAIQNRITTAEAKRNGQLTEAEKKQKRIQAIIEAASKHSNNFTTSTKQAGDEAAKLLAAFKDASHELGQTLLPHVVKFVKWLTASVQWVERLQKKARKQDPLIKKQADEFSKWWKQHKTVEGRILDQFNASNRKNVAEGEKARQKAIKDWNKIRAARAAAYKTLETQAAAQAKVQQGAAGILDINKEILKVQQQFAREDAKRQRTRDEFRRQELEDLRARQEQAKDLVRNSSEKLVQGIADQGGAFGTIASALTDIFEKTRVFASTGFGLKGIQGATKIFQENRNKANVDLVKQIELNKERLGLQGRSLEAAKQLAQWIQAGSDDTREFIANEKAANAQLSAGLSMFKARAKVGQVALEQANLQKDVVQFETKTHRTIDTLLDRRDALLKKGTREARATAASHLVIIQRLIKTNDTYQKIGSERRKILATAKAQAQVELEIEKIQQRRDRLRKEQDLQAQIATARLQRDTLRGGGEQAKLALDRQKQLRELNRAIEDNQLELRRAQKRLLETTLTKDERKHAKELESSLMRQIKSQQAVLGIVKKTNAERQKLLATQREQQRLASKRETEDLRARLKRLQAGSKDALGGTSRNTILQDETDKATEIRRLQEDLDRALQNAKQKLSSIAKTGTTADKADVSKEIKELEARLALTRQLQDENAKLTQQKLDGLTTTGAFLEQMRGQARGFSAQIGKQLAGTFTSFMGGVGNMVGGVFQTLASGGEVTAESMASNFLGLLGDIAMQMGSFFITSGTAAMFVPPYTGGGAVAGGLALTALGGALKGGASAISAPPSVSATGPSINFDNGPNTLPMDRTTEQRPVQMFFSVSQEPWDAATPEERFNNMGRWFGDMARNTGNVNPFGPNATPMGIRG